MDIFPILTAILSMIAMAAIVHIACKHAKLKAFVTGITSQPVKGTDAIFGSMNNSETVHAKQMVHDRSINIDDHSSYIFHFGNYKKMQNIQRTLVL